MYREFQTSPALEHEDPPKSKRVALPLLQTYNVHDARTEAILGLQRVAGNKAVYEALRRHRGVPGPHGVLSLARAEPAPTHGNAVIQRQWWRALGWRKLLGMNPANPLAEYEVLTRGTRYRVDTRPPSEIRSNGFLPKVFRMPADRITKKDIAAYQMSAVNNPGIVSVAETLEGARTVAHQLGITTPGTKYIYRVDVSGLIHYPMASNISFWQRLFYSEHEENMVAGGIEPKRIEFVEELETDGSNFAREDWKD